MTVRKREDGGNLKRICLTASRIRLRRPVVRGNYTAADDDDCNDNDDGDYDNKEDSCTS